MALLQLSPYTPQMSFCIYRSWANSGPLQLCLKPSSWPYRQTMHIAAQSVSHFCEQFLIDGNQSVGLIHQCKMIAGMRASSSRPARD
jgi:hypothetical protein